MIKFKKVLLLLLFMQVLLQWTLPSLKRLRWLTVDWEESGGSVVCDPYFIICVCILLSRQDLGSACELGGGLGTVLYIPADNYITNFVLDFTFVLANILASLDLYPEG